MKYLYCVENVHICIGKNSKKILYIKMLTVDFTTKMISLLFFPELLQWACIIFIIRKILNEHYYYIEFIIEFIIMYNMRMN